MKKNKKLIKARVEHAKAKANKKARKATQFSENIALLGAAQAVEAPQVEESQDYTGAIVGTSMAVLGAAAAIFAIRRCTKKDNDFERIN